LPSSGRVNLQEMPQGHEELAGMVSVIALQRLTDIVADHVANFLRAVWLFQQVLGHRSGRYLGHSVLEPIPLLANHPFTN
jgi:hypothetical protein